MFAKIHEVDGVQVLCQMGNHHEDGRPTLTYTTEVENVFVDLNLSFQDTDEGYEDRDKSFENFGLEQATAFRERVLEQFQRLKEEEYTEED